MRFPTGPLAANRDARLAMGTRLNVRISALLILLGGLLPHPSSASAMAPVAVTDSGTVGAGGAVKVDPPTRQDLSAVRQSVEQFVRGQATGLPGEVSVEVGQIDPRSNMPACLQLEPFLAHGSRIWGKTAVGVRCTAPSPWTIYVTANVHVSAQYLTAARPLSQGQLVTSEDLISREGDLTTLPAGVITDPALAIGRTTMSSLQLGAPLRKDTLRAQPAVQMGQTIRVTSTGPGFKVSTEGRAMNNATEGQTVQARTAAGQLVSGIARTGGILEVVY